MDWNSEIQTNTILFDRWGIWQRCFVYFSFGVESERAADGWDGVLFW